MSEKLQKAVMVFLTANIVFLTVTVIGLSTAAFLQPDPLQVVVTVLEDFAQNQTSQLAQHLAEVHTVLQGYTRVLAQLASFLNAEETRGQRLRDCLADPTKC